MSNSFHFMFDADRFKCVTVHLLVSPYLAYERKPLEISGWEYFVVVRFNL